MKPTERLDRIDAAMFGKRQPGLPVSCNYCGLLVADRDVHRLWHMLGEKSPLLYVGITSRGLGRFREHRRSAYWWEAATSVRTETFPTRVEAEKAELQAIHTELPIWNLKDRLPSAPPMPRSENRRANSMMIYLTGALAARMNAATAAGERFNWSAICQRAIEKALDEIEAAARGTF